MSRYLILVGVLFLYFYNLGLNQVWQPNEAFYADASKNMLKTGDFLTPVFNGEIRLNKPPLTYWLTALSFYLFGLNEFALRFFQALLGLGTGAITYLLARRLSGERGALYSFLALTLSFQFIANSRYTSPEVLLCFFTSLSLYLWLLSYQKGSHLLLLLALSSSALAVLTKGPVGFLMPAGVIFIYLLLTDRRELLSPKYYLGTLYVALAGGWWFIYQYIVNREAFLDIFLKENIRRIYALQRDPFYFYALDINVSFLPFSFIFYLALLWALRKNRRELLFPIVWFFTVFVAFSLVKMKIPVYIMPAFPAMAVITGSFLSSGEWRKALIPSSLFLTLLMVVALWVGALLLGFNPIFLVVSTLIAIFPLLKRDLSLAPAFAGFGLLLYLSGALLPRVEEYRTYREIGKTVKELDPKGELPTYELGAFHHNLPFYADRRIIRNRLPSQIEPPAVVLLKKGLMECKPIRRWKLYKGSESRFFKFLRDIKRNRNFYDFELCILGRGS